VPATNASLDHVLGIGRGAAINLFTRIPRIFVADHVPGIFCGAASLCIVKEKWAVVVTTALSSSEFTTI
jgi:hypothetical protein